MRNLEEIKDLVTELQAMIIDAEESLQSDKLSIAVTERFRAYKMLKDRFRKNKRLIKEKLISRGVNIDGELEKLLRFDYIPAIGDDDPLNCINDVKNGRRF